jgi:hypothetical protein
MSRVNAELLVAILNSNFLVGFNDLIRLVEWSYCVRYRPRKQEGRNAIEEVRNERTSLAA